MFPTLLPTLGGLFAGLALLLAVVTVLRSARRRTAVDPRTYAVTPLDAGLAIALVASLTGMSAVLLGS